MDPVENFRITREEEKNAFLGTGRTSNALMLADFVFGDPLIGIRDGKNLKFIFHHKPVLSSVRIYYNGKVMNKDAYIITGMTLNMTKGAPMYGDDIYADYISIAKQGEQP